ncbi:hypothetical protein K503DRAFT_858205 [Rhizopogon vinicolor AM-OR11-026]|uniref:Uncharacterized protein n=1 Tax=Rhizopogon vinicolor AM-OR11-026 TaxID=1314800 RepID=A0A1B7MU08_9AGAM|nr:hypothetical protein K503DRAFT_858205 [Rhizopogon vinicolor AM-OR11-026]
MTTIPQPSPIFLSGESYSQELPEEPIVKHIDATLEAKVEACESCNGILGHYVEGLDVHDSLSSTAYTMQSLIPYYVASRILRQHTYYGETFTQPPDNLTCRLSTASSNHEPKAITAESENGTSNGRNKGGLSPKRKKLDINNKSKLQGSGLGQWGRGPGQRVIHLAEPAIANLIVVTAKAPVPAHLRVKSNSLSFSLYDPHPPPDFWVSEARLMRRRIPNILGIAAHFSVRTCASRKRYPLSPQTR